MLLIIQGVPLVQGKVQTESTLSRNGHCWLMQCRVLCRGQQMSSAVGQIMDTFCSVGPAVSVITIPLLPTLSIGNPVGVPVLQENWVFGCQNLNFI